MSDYDLSRFIQPAPDTANDKALITPAPVQLIPETISDRVSQILDGSASASMPIEANAEIIRALSAVDQYQTVKELISSATTPYSEPLSCDQYLYIYLLDTGLTTFGACRTLGLSKTLPTIWRKNNRLFNDCIDALILAKAQEAELKALDLACTDDKAADERRFVVKAHNPKYRDNAPLPSEGKVSISILLDERKIDISDNYKVIGDETDRD